MKGRVWKSSVALLSVLVLVGCAQTDKGTKDVDKKENESQVINLMEQTEVGSLDTIFTQDEASINVQTNVFEGLYQLDGEDNVLPGVAKELPEISEDGKTYTIALREDSKWTNGDPVTAHDFIFAWHKLVNPENQANYFFLLEGTIENGTEIINGKKDVSELGVKALDDYTLEIKLEKPVAYFTSLLTFSPFFPQNEAFVEKQGKAYGSSSETIVSNGPFVIKNWDQTSMNWDLEKNEAYHTPDDVKSEKIHYEVIKEGNTAYNLYESGELDVAVLSGDLATNNKDNPDFTAIEGSKIYYLKLNQVRNDAASIFANDNVRKAIAYGLDKQSLAEQIVADGSKEVYGFVPNHFVSNPTTGADFREDAGDLAVTNASKAKDYIEKAKKELDGKIEIELLAKDGDKDKRIAEFIQGQLEDTLPGVTITIKTVPLQNSIELTKKGDYELAVGTWGPDYQDPTTFLNNLRTGNNSGYSNLAYDALLDAASDKYANDLEKRWETLVEAERIMVEEDAAIVPLFQESRVQLRREGLKGIDYHGFGATATLKHMELTE